MAIVQISWQDNSDNETSFKIYKGGATPLTDQSDQIATVALSGSTWGVSEFSVGSAPSLTLTSSNTGSSSETGEAFVITYDEQNAGSYFYGVSASNSVGDSDVVTSAQLTVS